MTVKINETVELTQKQFDYLDEIIRIVSWKYNNWGRLTWDDLRQEGWVKAIELLQDGGEAFTKRGDINYGFIRQAVDNRCIDLSRMQHRRQNQVLMSDIEDDNGNKDRVQSFHKEFENTCDWLPKDNSHKEFLSDVIVQEIRDLFEDGSDEQRYVELCAVYMNSKRGSEKVQKKIFKFERSMEIEIAELLGYPSTSSSRYRSMKSRVRATVANYMGWGENYNHRM